MRLVAATVSQVLVLTFSDFGIRARPALPDSERVGRRLAAPILNDMHEKNQHQYTNDTNTICFVDPVLVSLYTMSALIRCSSKCGSVEFLDFPK